MEFGLDVLHLAPVSGQETVTEAELVQPTGGIRLVRAVFAPNAQVGTGSSAPTTTCRPTFADKVKELPATLMRTPKPVGATRAFDEASWQLAVVVSAPASASEASATGVKLPTARARLSASTTPSTACD
jgi:hypothetical protein